jgi:isopenicillin N synthase-like dioxygenase
MPTPFEAVPIIDIAPYLDGDEAARVAVARQVARAAEEVGFLYVAGHGVAPGIIEGAFAQSRHFFAQPLAAKMAIDMGGTPNHRGYQGLYAAATEVGAQSELHEAFKVGPEGAPDDPDFLVGNIVYGPNAWPDIGPAFRHGVYGYYEAMTALARRMFGLFALALDLPEDWFEDKLERPASIMNVLHYPASDPDNPDVTSGIGAHSDYECFAILKQDDVGGLELCNQAGVWIPAPPIPGAFVINIGDMLARWSNDRFACTMHRVVNTTGRERYSIAFFANCNAHVEVRCLPSCHGPDNPPKYPPTTIGAH